MHNKNKKLLATERLNCTKMQYLLQ